jgi:hypothetical protein
VITVTDSRPFAKTSTAIDVSRGIDWDSRNRLGIADEGVTAAMLASNAVVSERQGGSATEWGGSAGGNTNYTPANTKIQVGNKLTSAGASGSGTVTYPVGFSSRAIVFIQAGVTGQTVEITNMDANGFDFDFVNPAALALPFYWMAIGEA